MSKEESARLAEKALKVGFWPATFKDVSLPVQIALFSANVAVIYWLTGLGVWRCYFLSFLSFGVEITLGLAIVNLWRAHRVRHARLREGRPVSQER